MHQPITDQVPAVGDQLGGLLLLRDSSFWERQSQFKKEILGLVVRMVAEAGIHFLRCLGFHESQLRCHHEKRVRILKIRPQLLATRRLQ